MMRVNHHKRFFMRAMVGAAALSMLGLGAAAKADDGPIRIGLIYTKQGPGAAIGNICSAAARSRSSRLAAKCSAGRSN